MRRGDTKFYAAVVIVVVIIVIVLRSNKQTNDFRAIAHDKLQLVSRSAPSSCGSGNVGIVTATTKRISVIVSTQAKEDAVITQTVNSILAHTNPVLLEEVIVVTDKHVTKDKKKLIVKEFSSYHPLVLVVDGESQERITNKFVTGHIAKGEIVVFIDDTVVVTSGYLLPLLEALQDHQEVTTIILVFNVFK